MSELNLFQHFFYLLEMFSFRTGRRRSPWPMYSKWSSSRRWSQVCSLMRFLRAVLRTWNAEAKRVSTRAHEVPNMAPAWHPAIHCRRASPAPGGHAFIKSIFPTQLVKAQMPYAPEPILQHNGCSHISTTLVHFSTILLVQLLETKHVRNSTLPLKLVKFYSMNINISYMKMS